MDSVLYQQVTHRKRP